MEVSMRSLNDNSIEGINHLELPVFSVQFDPEGYPVTAKPILPDDFVNMM